MGLPSYSRHPPVTDAPGPIQLKSNSTGLLGVASEVKPAGDENAIADRRSGAAVKGFTRATNTQSAVGADGRAGPWGLCRPKKLGRLHPHPAPSPRETWVSERAVLALPNTRGGGRAWYNAGEPV